MSHLRVLPLVWALGPTGEVGRGRKEEGGRREGGREPPVEEGAPRPSLWRPGRAG